MILAEAYDAFLLDLDGVVWRGEALVGRADEAIARLRELGKGVVFVTNNSSRTPRDYVMKLMRFKIPTSNPDVVTSGHVVVEELRRIGLEPGDKVWVLGGEGLVRLITHDRIVPLSDPKQASEAKALVVGWNPRATFEDVRVAADLARSGIPFIASNADATYPTERGFLPGTGAILAAIVTASGVEPEVVGKPKPALFRLALERAGVPAHRALFVGDRPETDVVGAKAAGIAVALALSGVTSEGDLGRLPALPDDVIEDLGDLLRDLPRASIERTDHLLTAVEGAELARLTCLRENGGVRLRELRVPVHFGPEASWRVVRKLLLTAVSDASAVEAAPDVVPYLERLGVAAKTEGGLF